MSYPRIGFTPARQPVPDLIRNMPANGLTKELAKGDACILVSGMVCPASGATNPTQPGYGVILAVYNSAGRPFTFQNTKYIASGNVGRADVCIDPNQTYVVQCITSVGPGNIGENVMIDVSAANATTGLSGMSVDFPASASISEYFKIINLSPLENLTGGYSQGVTGTGGANNGVEVKWNYHLLHSPTANAA